MRTPAEPPALEARTATLGEELRERLESVLSELPKGRSGPQELARALALDKVLTSRVLKALRSKDPIGVVRHLPGPDPLNRFAKAARRRGAAAETVKALESSIGRFQEFIRNDVGDRSALDTLISSWLPEAKAEFELRRRQSAFKAMSQLKGAAADNNLGTVVLHPSEDGEHVDVVWVFGLLGLRRLRPGVPVKLNSRRESGEKRARHPTTLGGLPITDPQALRLDQFCHDPPAEIEVDQVGDRVQYLLGGNGFGARARTDLILAEVNLAEMRREIPRAEGRQAYVFAEVGTPSHSVVLDVIVSKELYSGAPQLYVYDTALEGIASPNDRARDIDREELTRIVTPLESDPRAWRIPEIPAYVELCDHVLRSMKWSATDFQLYRARVEYPLYGSQLVMTFDASQG